MFSCMDSSLQSSSVQARYTIKKKLGAGGMASVYKAWDNQLKRHVAIKRLHRHEADEDKEQVERMWREAMTMASIQHPNILTIHDFGIDAKGPFVIMEFIDGQTLQEVVAQAEKPYVMQPFKTAVLQILEGLIAAHHLGLLHRDLKPQNIMVSRLPSGLPQYKILDFGLAKFITAPTVQTMENNSICGSVYYLSPEQLSRKPIDERTDLYAIGCVFYFMLTGSNAFQAEDMAAIITRHLQHDVIPLQKARPDLSAAICAWVMKLFAFDPMERFSTASLALKAFQQLASRIDRETDASGRTRGKTQIVVYKRKPAEDERGVTRAVSAVAVKSRDKLAPSYYWKWVALIGVLACIGLGVVLYTVGGKRSEPRRASGPAVKPLRYTDDKQGTPTTAKLKPKPDHVPEPTPDTMSLTERADPALPEKKAPDQAALEAMYKRFEVKVLSPLDLDALSSGHDDDMITVQGQVKCIGASTSGKTQYLLFDPDPKKTVRIGFSVKDWKDKLKQPLAQFLEEKYVGKTIKVKGQLKVYYGYFDIDDNEFRSVDIIE